MGESKLKLLGASSMGGIPIIGGAGPRAPDAKQSAAMEAKACQFADALLFEGMALDAPDKRLMTRLLVMRAASKVIGRLSSEEKIVPSIEIKHQAEVWPRFVQMALQGEIEAAQKLAQALAMQTEGSA